MSRSTDPKGPAFAGPARPRPNTVLSPPPLVTETVHELAQHPTIGRRQELANLGPADDELEVDELADRLERHGPAMPGTAHGLARRIVAERDR